MPTPPTHEIPDAWFRRLQRLVAEDQEWRAPRIQKDFFGEDWILPQVFWEAVQADRIGDLLGPLDDLRKGPLETLYDPAMAQQGLQVAQGAILTLLAACHYEAVKRMGQAPSRPPIF